MDKPAIGGIPLFAGLGQGELGDIVRIFERVTFEPGACLVRQGHPADSAFILESGAADVITALPGGGEAKVAQLGPGSVLGEMALLESGVRSATVIASSALAGHFIERDSFRMLLAQRNQAAFAIQGRIIRTLCQRLRELNAKIVSYDLPGNAAPAIEEQGGERAPARGRASFDWRAFLPVLPVFRRFSAVEIAEFADMAEAMEAGRGQALFRQGEASCACYIVVRGAIEITGARNGRRHRIGILGPGKLCGILALIEGQPHSMSAIVRERAMLLEIGKATFDKLLSGKGRVSARFQDAINQELLQALARTNNHLTRLISQARIRDGLLKKNDVAELERALGTQDCRAA